MKEIEIILFGSTGDLAVRKIIPALELLYRDNFVSELSIIAIGRRKYSNEEYISFISENKKYKKNFLKKIRYIEADISKEMNNLKDEIKTQEPIFFFATAPEFYSNIVLQLKKLGLTKGKAIFEKPFGDSEDSAKRINEIIEKTFDEKKIFRIDHYLGKETVQNILVLRFANSVFEPIWNNKYIRQIQITIDETLGIEKRGQYYDKTGAIKDMLQNHILQVLSILMMDSPKSLNSEDIHEEKLKVLKNIKINEIITGQYEGYLDEEHVNKNSDIETFIAANLEINLDRYKGIPIFIRTGKKLEKKEAKIIIEFKEENHRLFRNFSTNKLILNISPEQDITFNFNTKKAGINFEISQEKMEFCHKCVFKENSSQGYEKLIIDIINDDKTLFITEKELIESWKIIDNIIVKKPKPIVYKQYKIPNFAIKLLENKGFEWI